MGHLHTTSSVHEPTDGTEKYHVEEEECHESLATECCRQIRRSCLDKGISVIIEHADEEQSHEILQPLIFNAVV